MTIAVPAQSVPASAVTELYLRTKALHTEAERSGIVSQILHGSASLEGYILFLRNLLPAYKELESALDQPDKSAALNVLSEYRLDRATAIENDLAALSGCDWTQRIPLLPEGDAYAQRVARVSQEKGGARLIAHAYTRYLGDLSGGQILKRLLTRSLSLKEEQLTFYDFPQFPDLSALKNNYREALNQAGAAASTPADVAEEGAIAFTLNIKLSRAVESKIASDGPSRD